MNRFINDKNLKIKAASIMLIFLVASIPLWSVFLVPIYSLNANTAARSDSCGCCGVRSSSSDEAVISVLDGDDRLREINKALEAPDFRNVVLILEGKGFTGILDNATARIIELSVNGTLSNFVLVAIPFAGEGELAAGASILSSEKYTIAVAVIIDSKDKAINLIIVSYEGRVKSKDVMISIDTLYSTLSTPECTDDQYCKDYYSMFACCQTGGWCQDYCSECIDNMNCYQGYVCVDGYCREPPGGPAPYPWCWACLILCEFAIAAGCEVPALLCLPFCGAVGALCAGPHMPICVAVCKIICAAMIEAICQVIIKYGYHVDCGTVCREAGHCP